MYRSKKAVFSLMVLLAVAAGCDDNKTVTLNQCETDGDCANQCETDTFSCNAGVCACTEVVVKAACTDDDDCQCGQDATASCVAGDCYCNTATTETRPACSQDADCAPGCDGYDNAVCSATGVCFCADAIPQEVAQCNADDDCTDGCAGYDTFSCSAGQCYCSQEAELQCHADDDCAAGCFGADSFACKGGMCHCSTTETETLPSCTDASDCDCTMGTAMCQNSACYCNTEVALKCETDDDCAAGCTGADSFACNAGLCYCTDIQVQEPTLGRLLVAVFPNTGSYEISSYGEVVATHTGTASFELPFATYTVTMLPIDGYKDPTGASWFLELSARVPFNHVTYSYTPLEKPNCTEDSDCECFDAYVPRCFGGVCACVLDSDCPAAFRRDMVEALYVALGHSGCPMTGYENPCSDIPDGLQACQWAALVEDGLVSPYTDANGNPLDCVPGDTVNRAAFVKTLITAIDGLAGYQPPNVPTFDDVAANKWYFDYVEAAVQLGLVRGYTDDHGTLTGLFGPSDLATTCWMDEVLQRAAEGGYLPENPQPAPTLLVEIEDENGQSLNAPFVVQNEDWEEVFRGTGPTSIVGLPPGKYIVIFQWFEGYVTPESKWTQLPALEATVRVPVVYSLSTFNVRSIPFPGLTVVAGEDNVQVMGLEMEADEDVTLKQLTVNFFADDFDFYTSFAGNTPANWLVASATLVNQDGDVVSGPMALEPDLGRGDPNEFDAHTGDNYYAQFPFLDLQIPAGTATELFVRVNLINSVSIQPVYLRVGVSTCSWGDIQAEDADFNSVPVNGHTQNCPYLFSPTTSIREKGTLGYMLEQTYSFMECAGFGGGLWAKYAFIADYEDFVIDKLTLVNDLEGSFGDNVEETLAVNQVQISYPDINGVKQTAYAPLINGQVTFRDLGFYVPAGEMVRLEISGNTHHMIEIGEQLSGEAFRIGLLATNDLSTFEALGQTSSQTLHDFNANGGGGTTYLPSVLRKAYPYIKNVTGLSTVLINGDNRLFGFQVDASCGSVGFGRFTFQVSGAVVLSDFRFYRGSTLLDTANIVQVNDKIIVSFEQEEVITSGVSQTYYLNAAVSEATVDDVVQTRLMGDSLELDIPNSCHANANTARVHDSGGAGIFTGPDGFSSIDVYGARVVWSDRSADAHAYPTVTDGLTEAGTGSCDWTNGYYLRIESLSPHTLTY